MKSREPRLNVHTNQILAHTFTHHSTQKNSVWFSHERLACNIILCYFVNVAMAGDLDSSLSSSRHFRLLNEGLLTVCGGARPVEQLGTLPPFS